MMIGERLNCQYFHMHGKMTGRTAVVRILGVESGVVTSSGRMISVRAGRHSHRTLKARLLRLLTAESHFARSGSGYSTHGVGHAGRPAGISRGKIEHGFGWHHERLRTFIGHLAADHQRTDTHSDHQGRHANQSTIHNAPRYPTRRSGTEDVDSETERTTASSLSGPVSLTIAAFCFR